VLAAIPELRNPKVTSLSPVEIYRCLRLKVWDVNQQKMVALDGSAK
jgi:omega-6 fatty acid desaturase (delta-12 desaturase)